MTTEETKLPNLWAKYDLPVLRHTAELIEVHRERDVSPERVARDLELPREDTLRSLIALHEANYIAGTRMDSMNGKYVVANSLTERGRRAVGIWPSGEGVDALVEALQQAAEATSDPDERSKLRKAAGAVLGVSRSIMTEIIGAVAAKSMTGQ